MISSARPAEIDGGSFRVLLENARAGKVNRALPGVRTAPHIVVSLALVLFCVSLRADGATMNVVAVLRDDTALAGAHDIEVREGIAFIAGKRGSLAIVDVQQPAAPKLLWSARDERAYEDAETMLPLGADRLLIGSRDALLFDVTTLTQPKEISRVADRARLDTVNGFARRGDTVFGANKQGHVFALDVSVPDKLALLGSRSARSLDGLGSPHDVALLGELLVVVSPEGFGRHSRPGKLAVYRVADPQTHQTLPADEWQLIGKLEHPRLAGANRVRARGHIAYVGSSLTSGSDRTDDLRNNVSIIDLADPAKPSLRGSILFPDARGPNGLEIADHLVFAAGGQTVQAIDVTNPEAPNEIAHLTSPAAFPGAADDAHDLVFRHGHLFVTAQNSHALVVIRLHPSRRSP